MIDVRSKGRLLMMAQKNEETKFYTGGKIFYIDETASGATYTFYSRTGAVLTDVRVGDEPFAYSVSGTPLKDKYYVFNENAVYSKTWTYKSGDSWVYQLLGTTDGIGTGKTNTAHIKVVHNGAYENYSGTIWNSIKALNDNADKGCTDWFVPSKTELEALRVARDRNGNKLTTVFNSSHPWSSVEWNGWGSRAWYYNFYSYQWQDDRKDGIGSMIPARSF